MFVFHSFDGSKEDCLRQDERQTKASEKGAENPVTTPIELLEAIVGSGFAGAVSWKTSEKGQFFPIA